MDDPRFPPPPTAESAERALQPPDPRAPDPATPGKGVKETVESILIAFILAFVFRAFVVEAFVIPTGSMATTLLGAHMRFTCKECGYQFDVNYPAKSSGGDDVDIPAKAGPVIVKKTRVDPDTGRRYEVEEAEPVYFDVYCPNCRQQIPKKETENHDVRYGDRILVMKYLYVVSPPKRWDVVVFKTPQTGLGGVGAPQYTVNYIKRLVGLPNEQVRVLFGDVYTREKSTDPWQIRTKPKYAQDALWRLVYDHDFRPSADSGANATAAGARRWTLPWVHGTNDGWDTGDKSQSRVFAFDNLAGAGRLWFDPTKIPGYDPEHAPGGYFSDWLAYDVTMDSGPRYPVYTATDLRLCFSYQRKAGNGPLQARLTKLDHEFLLELLPDRVRLLHRSPGQTDPVEIAALQSINPASIAGPIRVEFANVDYQVSVRLNDQLAFQTSYPPDVEDLEKRKQLPRPSVSIEASRQQAALSHVSLWRDVYYTPVGSIGWRDNEPNYSTTLGPDDYFVMGDNSAASMDARYWDRPVDLPNEGQLHVEAGRVPGRFMLGRAFFVYWPAGYAPFPRAPSLVPDFGGMRLIH